jgi:surface polysaccharide O-acyltransferase-like enzyme
MSDKTRRIAWIDRARAFGAVSIVLLHVLVSANIAFEQDIVHQLSYAAVSIVFTRWAVPAFFMLSGYLLLKPDREVSLPKALGRAKRMAIVLATFGYAFALMEEFVVCRAAGTLGPQIIWRAALDVLEGRSWDHLWYVYAQLFVYLAEPAVLAFRKRCGERGLAALVAVLFIAVLVVPTILGIEAPNFLIGLTCFCLGGLLDCLELGPVLGVVGVGSLATMLYVSLTSVLAGTGDAGYIFLQGSFLAAAYAVFVLGALRRLTPEGAEDSRALSELSRESFGIYVIHPFYVHLALMVLSPALVPSPFFEVTTFCAVLALTFASVKVCRHIPIIKDVL